MYANLLDRRKWVKFNNMPRGIYSRTNVKKSKAITRVTATADGPKKGRPKGSHIDHRAMLALLPGKLLAKRQIEVELNEIREQIRSGNRREYIALLPGLEMEHQRVSNDLIHIADILASPFHFDRRDDQPVKQVEIEAPATQKQVNGGVDVGTLFPHGTHNREGKPIIRVVMLQQLMETGQLERKTFSQQWVHAYASLKQTSTLAGELTFLKQAGIKFDTSVRGRIVLKSRLVGELPKPRVALPEPEPSETPAPSVVPLAAGGRFEGSVGSILIQEFKAAPDWTLDFPALEKKYNARKYSFNWAMNNLKETRQFRFKQVGRGLFRMLKEGRPSRRGQ
jgi:hypothetical protein